MTQDELGGSVVNQQTPPPQAVPDADPAGASRPAPPRARLIARFQPVLNAALWQNHVPVLSELAVANAGKGSLGDIEIELGCQPPVLRARTWRAAGLAAGQIRKFDDLDIPVDGPFLSDLSEATRGTVSLVARSGGEIVGEFTQDIRILAPNEWGGTAGIPDILAAFVQPNDPAVARIIHEASDLLRASGKTDSFEGYQGCGKTRVWEQAQAIWNAVCRMDVRYINPPPSFVGGGQRIRTARQIGEERLATCLDLAVLFCSCLEATGLRPLIVLQREHAFAGVWLSKGDFGTSTVDDAPGLRTRLKLDDLKLFETTGVTALRKPSFQQATLAGAAHVEPENDADFEGLIDIHRARQRRILPLAGATTGYAFQAGVADAAEIVLPAIEDAPPLRDDVPVAEEPPAARRHSGGPAYPVAQAAARPIGPQPAPEPAGVWPPCALGGLPRPGQTRGPVGGDAGARPRRAVEVPPLARPDERERPTQRSAAPQPATGGCEPRLRA